MNTRAIQKPQLWITVALLLVAGAAIAATPAERIVRTSAGFESERGDAVRRAADSFTETTLSGSVGREKTSGPTANPNRSTSCCAFWVYDATTALFDDFDGDSHYSYLRVNFDVDTNYADAWVYAKIYLRGTTGGWVKIFESDDFLIYGASSSDDYEVETELVAGFPPDYYDVLIEVYDADYHDLVAEFGPADSPELSQLPMEDVSFDFRTPPPIAISHGHGGGGAISALTLGMLFLIATAGLRRRGV